MFLRLFPKFFWDYVLNDTANKRAVFGGVLIEAYC
jgi:hypothetical protein